MTIRQATPDDIPTIRAIALEAWPAAYFPEILSAEQLAYMLVLLYSERVLCDAMTKKNQHFFLLEDAGAAIGFASCTPHYARSKVTHLNKLYVRPAVKGHGAGKALLLHVLGFSAEQGDKVIELNVNKRNEAIGFYEHMGFRILREEVIDIGSGYVMDDYVMGRSI